MTDSAPASAPTARPVRSAGGDDSFNVAALALIVMGVAFLILGMLLMLATSAFVAILGGAVFAFGGASLAGYLVVRAVKSELK